MGDGVHTYGICDLDIIGDMVLLCSPKKEDFTIYQDCKLVFTLHGIKQTVVLEAGITTDLASVPRVLWSIVPPHQLIKRWAVAHDCLYARRPFVVGAYGSRRILKGEADAILYLGCLLEGMDWRTCREVYEAVSTPIGDIVWNKHDVEFPDNDATSVAGAATTQNAGGPYFGRRF